MVQSAPSVTATVPVEEGPGTSTSGSSDSIEIPSHWRPETNACIRNKQLTNECRLDIIRTLVTLATCKFGPDPPKHQLEEIARKLVLKYPFMRDGLGSGYVSSSIYSSYIYISTIYVIYLVAFLD